MNPETIRFAHDSVSENFQNGRAITELARDLQSGTVNPSQVEPIKVVEWQGKQFAMDGNRRLLAFQMADVDIPATRVSLSDPKVSNYFFKSALTTPPEVDGLWVWIRGIGEWVRWPP